ncbi:phosphatase PAP2 family protein [Streptomyces acidiscabies]|uniref:Phosphatase PAP2 family protein n=1 Tax=Streptomyces acidiscabies TaxID=42234 RepID=A0AAP6BIW1_9ACTN|nr:phosphatase PAP2 family protein [Streptomyces acidiscabies]MDX2965562.1 phosphatase PAP2 family protein [Streptomyces acidiscabies]MDX3025118.1 phosphatase PAP2 family protein [Streptomyces acidiscabies]MDX3795494.1 phosphatase PAP2 family protein [Streptomyces acidiscabies]
MGDVTVTSSEGREPTVPVSVTAKSRRVHSPRRPRLWFEILLIAVSYWTYSLIRNAVPEQKSEALRNADWIWRMEHHLGIAVEESVNHAVNSVTWLIVGMNYYYATLHFIVTLGVLVWLYRSHPGRYAATRLVLFATTAVALVGYYFYPLAPPRLMNGGDFIDTVVVHETWGSMASGDLKNMSNQYAAMPSMHIGWSLWCGLTIFFLARLPWVRVLGLLYPTATLIVIVSTANHFWLDAVGGILCLAFGFFVAWAVYGTSPYRLPQTVAAGVPAWDVVKGAAARLSGRAGAGEVTGSVTEVAAQDGDGAKLARSGEGQAVSRGGSPAAAQPEGAAEARNGSPAAAQPKSSTEARSGSSAAARSGPGRESYRSPAQ